MLAKGKSVGIISIKGGVGKTTTVVNLAHSLSKDYGKKVLIVDANFSAPNVALHLGNINLKKTVSDFLNQKAKPSDVIYKHDLGFDFIPASLDNNNNTNPSRLKQKVQQLKNIYDIVLLDSSPNLNEELLAAMVSSDELYVISTPDLPTLSTTLRAVKLAKEKKTHINGMILNKVRGKKFELKAEDMERLSGVPLVGKIKDNIRVLESLSKFRPMTHINPESSVSREYRKIAARLANTEYNDVAWHKKVLGYLKDDFSNLTTHKWSKRLSYYK